MAVTWGRIIFEMDVFAVVCIVSELLLSDRKTCMIGVCREPNCTFSDVGVNEEDENADY